MISFIGDVKGAERLTKNLDKVFQKTAVKAHRQIGLLGERAMIKWLEKQPSLWEPLSEDYYDYKDKKGYSTQMLVRTNEMRQRITSVGVYNYAFVGLKYSSVSSEGENLANIAAIMESGYEPNNLPARPFIGPTFRIINTILKKNNTLKKILIKELSKYK